MDPRVEDALAQVAELTGLTRADIQAWTFVEDPDDAVAILRAYQAAGMRLDVSTWDRAMEIFRVVSEVAGVLIPIVGLAGSIRALLA